MALKSSTSLLRPLRRTGPENSEPTNPQSDLRAFFKGFVSVFIAG